MTGRTHQILGITSGFGYYLLSSHPAYGPATLATVIIGSHLAALLPDIDQPAADIWDSLPFGHTVGRLSNPFVKHRNISHSLLGLGLAAFILSSLLNSFPLYWGIDIKVVFLACVIAYVSHLAADMVTSEGIPLFYPYRGMMGIPPRPFDGFRILTGKWFENLVIFPLLNLVLIALVYLNWQTIRAILFK